MSSPKGRARGGFEKRPQRPATLTAGAVRAALKTLGAPTWHDLAQHLKVRKGAGAHRLRRLLRGLEHSGEVRRGEGSAYSLNADAAVVLDEVVEVGGVHKLRDSGQALPAAAGARAGDRVEVRRGPLGPEVQRIVEPSPTPVVGCLVEGWRGQRFVESLDPAVKGRIDVEDDDDTAQDGDIVEIRLLWATERRHGRGAGRRRFAGRIVRVLATRNEADRAATAMLASHGVPVAWPPEVPQAAPPAVTEADAAGRLDLTHLPLVTIDGADARDFDDAVFAAPRPRGGWRLVVAIADVAHYVASGSALDLEAHRRGNSVYLPDRVIPMLPEALSNGICSLRPHERRLALVCDMQVSATGRISGYTFAEAVIQSRARLVYEDVAARLERGAGHGGDAAADEAASLRALFDVYQALRGQRTARGALDLDARETVLTLREGRVAAVSPTIRNDAHRLIEEAMIAANVCAARHLERLGAMYRIHEAPAGEKRAQLASALALGGVSLGAGPLSPKSLQAALEAARARSALPPWLLAALLLRSLPQARYDPRNLGHFGLALPKYVHFTSPIRRYADLMVHRIIKSGVAAPQGWLEDAATHISMTERRADDVTRAVADWLKCDFIAHRVGERFAGIVAGVTEFGLFVELEGVGVQGLVHVSRLGTDYYQFVPASMSLVGERSGHRYTLGDALIVALEEVSVEARRVGLAVVRRAQPSRGRA